MCRKGTFRTKNCQCYFCLLHCPRSEWEPNKRMISSQLGLTLTLQDIWTWGERRAGYIMITVSSFKPLRRGGGEGTSKYVCVCVLGTRPVSCANQVREKTPKAVKFSRKQFRHTRTLSLSHSHTLLYSLTHVVESLHVSLYLSVSQPLLQEPQVLPQQPWYAPPKYPIFKVWA